MIKLKAVFIRYAFDKPRPDQTSCAETYTNSPLNSSQSSSEAIAVPSQASYRNDQNLHS